MKHHQIPYNYVVFLSFRGKDTRKKFTDHLYNALKSAGIHTFRDNNEIDSGADIEEECLKAIEESRISIVVLSKGYASSTWCLDELVHIMKCRRELGQTVWPVFYDVDPTDVEELSGSFGEGFVEAEKRSVDDLERVGRWKDALRQVVYLKGLDLPNHADGHEAENIKHIVDVISDKLNHKSLIAARHPVGLEPRADRVIALLRKKSVVSICGMGGIGKTTIAKEVYNCISKDFEGSCFLENVRSSSDTKGIKKLQRQLLSKILKRKHEKIDNVDQGVNIIQERLCRKKVFIVIDDVDRLGQIHKILGDLDWICPGSKVVITTRTQDLLPPSRSCAQYEVQELSDVDSLRLFSLYAFNECSPFEDYASLAERVVSYAGGNPLALEVLGSSLRGENVDIWRSKLEKLMLIGHKDVHNILKISFDSLDNMDKFLFLDIACFFIGKNKDYVMSILDDCGFCTVDGLNTLRKRCLISIGDKKKLMMHDLIRDMGRDIVFGDPPILDPGKRSRLWHHDDAIDVLENQLGTEAVEGLVLNSPGSNYSFETKAFKRMTRLRLLQINYIVLSGSFKYVSSKLRWLCWRESSLESLPVDLNLENLVALDMRYSSLRRFSEEVKHLKKLKFLNLNHSHKLEKTPNFEGLPSLQMLLLKDCTNLMEVHHSIGHLTHLVSLNLQDCQSLKNLPETLSNLRSLETLNLSGCTNLEELPEDLGTLKSLGVLLLDGTAITRVPKSIADLENLRSLSLRDCPLIFSPTEGSRVFSILPSSLQTLDIQYCNIYEDAIPQNLDLGLPLLRIMKLCGNNFQSLPTSIAGLPMLHTLWLNDCRDLRVVPQLQPTLQKFHAQNCPLLESIDLTDIRGESDIELSGCSNLKEVKGYYSLEPLEVGIVDRLLKTGGSFIGENLANPCVRMLDNLTNTYRIRDPQALSERGLYSIFLPGSHIPTWFSYQSEGDYLSFDVPPLRQGSKIIGFVTCAIYAWEAYNKACYFTTSINIINKTKNFCWSYTPYITFLSSEVDRDIMWMCYWMFENQKEGIDTFDMGWRFKYELEQGDELIFFIDMGYGITVKRCGLHFLCLQAAGKRDILSNDITIVSHASSRNNRRFLKSRPRWLKIDHQHKIKVEEMSNPFHDSDFMRWTKQLGERLNQTPDYDYKYVRPSQLTMNLVSETSSSFKKKKVREETEKKEENTKLIPFVPHPSLESTEPEIHDKAIEDSRNEDIPMKEKVVYVEPTTEPLVDAEPLSTKYKAKSEVETGSSSSLSSSIGHIDIKVSLPRSKLSSSFDSGSSSGSQTISGNRLAELSSKIRRPRPPLIGSKVSGSSKALTPNFVQQQREALSHYLNMSLEDVEKAKKFEEIESIVLLLAQNTTNLYEKIKLDDLVSRLVELKETVASNVTLAISAEAERETIDAKATDISTRLMQQQEQLSSLEAEFSRLSEEETELDTQIQRLIEKREEVVAQKNLVAREWEETKQEEEKQLDEWDNLEMEVRQTNENWVRTKETLAQANAKWELIKENLK